MIKRHRHSISHQDKVEYKSALGSSNKYKTVRSKKKSYKKFCLLLVVIVIGVLVFYFGSIGISLISAANEVLPNSVSLKDFVSKSNLKQTDGVTNILLLGRDQAAQLTDTIQVVRIRQDDKKVAMVSLPRDLQVTVPGDGIQKINAVFGQGYTAEKQKDKKVEAGANLAAKTVEKVSGVPIHYYITADFAGLKDVVNALGGVTLDVEKSFSDSEYPKDYFTKDGQYVKTDGFDPFSVKAGTQTMDGITALKFARSRHGNNGEGSDFARAARQQKVILAIKEKSMTLGFLANPVKITELIDSLGGHIKTNMGLSEIKDMVNYMGGVGQSNIITKVISNDPKENLLVSVDEGGYYLKPKAGNFSEVQKFFKNVFDEGLSQASIEIKIYNGSGKAGLATKFSKTLESAGLSISTVDSNPETVATTTIYDGSNQSEAFGKIKSQLENPKIENYNQQGVIKVVVGQDYGN